MHTPSLPASLVVNSLPASLVVNSPPGAAVFGDKKIEAHRHLQVLDESEWGRR